MRKILQLLVIVIFMIGIGINESRGERNAEEKSTTLYKQISSEVEEPIYGDEIDPDGRRLPSRPLMCLISLDGLQIDGIDCSEIFLYEVRDEDGMLIASYSSMQEFIHYVLTNSDTIEMRLYIGNYILKGYV